MKFLISLSPQQNTILKLKEEDYPFCFLYYPLANQMRALDREIAMLRVTQEPNDAAC